jgi:hypothetical protein
MIIICPGCGEKEKVVKNGIRKINLKDGSTKTYQMYLCKVCLAEGRERYRFSEKQIAEYLGSNPEGIPQPPVESLTLDLNSLNPDAITIGTKKANDPRVKKSLAEFARDVLNRELVRDRHGKKKTDGG